MSSEANEMHDDSTSTSDALSRPEGTADTFAPVEPAAEAPADSNPLDETLEDEIASADEAPAEPEEPPVDYRAVIEATPHRPTPTGERRWYILKVASNREDSIRNTLLRRIRVAGLEEFFGDIVVPVEMRTEFKNGKKKVVRVKLYPGYLVINMELNDDTWFLIRETGGIGDFTGAGGHPQPMPEHEVARIVKKVEEKTDETPKINIRFKQGERVRINDGMFTNFEGSVEAIDETNGRVTVMINIFGRSTPVELEYWQVETL